MPRSWRLDPSKLACVVLFVAIVCVAAIYYFVCAYFLLRSEQTDVERRAWLTS